MSTITTAGLNLIARKSVEDTLTVDQFVFANIPDLDTTVTPPGTEILPPAADIVYLGAVTQAGYVDPNTIVYSIILSSAIGDFDFNWIGLYSSVDETLVAVKYVPTQRKVKTAGGNFGNNITRNFAMQYNNATALTAITVSASTWQIDFSSRLRQIDERERLANLDLYGNKYFFDDGFLLVDAGGGAYQVSRGIAYVEGIRLDETAATPVGAIGTKPTDIYVDAVLSGDMGGRLASWSIQISDTALTHYIDAAANKHYLHRIATINSDGSVVDKRRDGSSSRLDVGIDDIPGLQAAIDSKAGESHIHTIDEVTGLQDSIDSKISSVSSSLGESGHVHLSNGFILQWGYSGAMSGHTRRNINFSKPFPNRCLSVVPCMADNTTVNDVGLGAVIISRSQIQLISTRAGRINKVYFQAIGF